MILISVYIPPDRDTWNYQLLCNAIYNIVSSYLRAAIYYASDLNLPDMCWNTNSVSDHRYPIEINNVTLDLVYDCGFTQMVELPTRGSNLLDSLLTYKQANLNSPICSISRNQCSDHDIILTTIQMKAMHAQNTACKIYGTL